LPAAIAAPTPVSSLVHSSTLVTAGVYLLIRFNICSNVSILGFFLRLITMFIAGLCANYEFDLKKIIALSTLRQLGLIIRFLFIGDRLISFYHLLRHALFKALLFICAGSFIHNLRGIQDIRYIGNMYMRMPLTRIYFNISNLCLCGFPFLSGFYSKDLILDIFSIRSIRWFVYLIFYISVGLTVSYRLRLFYYFMIKDKNILTISNLEEN
jgi:NADH-ubiquinone oxidoreductase chain 5